MKKLFSLLFIAVLTIALNNSAFTQNVNVTPNPATYLTLGAAFTAINAGLHGAGAVAVSIKGNTTEPASAILNGGVFTSCSITPVGPRTVTGNLNLAVIDLNGADNVTIDGLNTGGNSLTVINPNAGTGANGLQCSNGANNNTFRNVTAVGAGAAGATAGGRGFNIGQSTAATSGNNDNTIENCTTNGFRRGVQTFGTAGLFANERTIIRNSTVKNFSHLGIFVGTETRDNLIDGNQVFLDNPLTPNNTLLTGIQLQGSGSQIFRRNKVSSLLGAVAAQITGIITLPLAFTAPLVTPPTTVEVSNNMVALNNSLTTSTFVVGIQITNDPTSTNYTANVYHNSVRIGGSSGGTAVQTIGALLEQDGTHGPDTCRYYNNLAINERLDGTLTSLHIGSWIVPASGLTVKADRNVAFSRDTTGRGWDAAYRNTIYNGPVGQQLYQDTLCGLDIEQESAFDSVRFVSDVDLHLVNSLIGGNMDGVAQGGDYPAALLPPGLPSIDYDGESRMINANNLFTYRGCDEILIIGSKGCLQIYWKTQETVCYPYRVTTYLRVNAPPYIIRASIFRKVRAWITVTNVGCMQIYWGPLITGGSYYLELRTKHTIRTQSANFLNFPPAQQTYDFTTAAGQAFGNNMEGPVPFKFYNGDVNQDDIVDGTDAAAADNDAFNFRSGCYINTDVNDDGIVDGSDALIIDNNATNFVQAILLPGTGPGESPVEQNSNDKATIQRERDNVISVAQY